ncbi:NUDIX hydrolase [Sphingomonas yantingensis]|uniref:8-oxo-dGTP pyrophosphatase MutT (NUDIX family) n=1 Tax=Sphingomonas yantingensis TaxID=1241761 RepID=A0A7W9AT70_9SPHN|nr:8-oxo-dGTP pyrophosphatase MutT (NUDIX family) [Sphingomonas yantingensis]
MSDPIPAATLVILRDRPGGPEVLMVERGATLAFAGGALVFPGGRIDAGDHAIARAIGGDPEDTAARIAAIRETIEEVGLAIGIDSSLAKHREALLAGEPAETLLPTDAFDLDTLVYFARWLPLGLPHRIFDTRFYLARGDGEPEADGEENARAFWTRPADVLAGDGRIIFPTRRNLERLATFESVEVALADACARPVQTVTPWVEDRGGVPHLCIPGDLGYPVTAEPMASAERA